METWKVYLQKQLSCLLLSIALGGCMVGPNYKPPENNVPGEWAGTSSAGTAAKTEQEPLTEWWKVFGDHLLDKCIGMAALYNKDVLTAEANILQARALRQVAASGLFPQLDADFNATKTYFSKNGPVFAIGPSATSSAGSPTIGTPSPTSGLPFQVQVPQIQNLFNALFDATWEIDLFGKTRRSVEAAKANIGSAIEQRNDILISVIAEVARNYMELRSYQKLAELIKENIALLEKNKEVVQERLKWGYANKLDLETAEAELASARADLPNISAQIYKALYAISILTGNLPESLADDLLPIAPLPKPPCEIAVGIRSDLLRRRPDVRYSERQLAAATANVGVAVASFFPTITMGADIGFQTLTIRNLFSMGSKTWALGGDINLPLFQGGRLVGNLRANRAAASAAAYAYQQAVLTALQDAESSLVTYSEDLATVQQLKENAEMNRRIVWLTEERYIKGLVGVIDLLDSERQLNTSEQNLLKSDMSALVDLVSLYKALGGGWEPVKEKESSQ